MTQTINRQVLRAKRLEGAPKPDDFRIIDGSMPAAGAGELLLCNLVPADEADVGGVRQLEDVIGSAQLGHEAGGLLEEPAQPLRCRGGEPAYCVPVVDSNAS